MLKYSLLILLAILFLLPPAYAQSPEKALENIRNNYTKENLYIHYDKENYVAGETIWFKAYLTAGSLPSFYSTALNVELLNDSGRMVKRQILPLLGGTAVGAFELAKDAPQMNYTVRAYTRRMMNFGSDYFYEHQLQVFNPSNLPTPAAASKEHHIYFLPEGGNLVAGIANVIAFKATDKYGYPLECEGQLMNSNGEEMLSFKTVHDGMGKFYLLPQPGENYSAIVTIDGVTEKVNLPGSKISGVTLQVLTQSNKKYFIVNKEKVASKELDAAYLLGVMDNTILFRQDLNTGNFIKGQLPFTDLPSGILQLTVFNKNDQPLAERLLFVKNAEMLVQGRFKADTVSLKPHGRNSFSFAMDDTLAGTFSVSVTDIGREIPSGSRENIISSLMLSNDIKGYIHNPLYYFETDDIGRQDDLDLVMLTNGWRRFNWDQLLNNKLPVMTYKDGNYISVSAKAYREVKNVLITNTSLNVFINTRDSASDFLQVDVDKEGMINIPGMIFQDTATMAFQENTGKNRNVAISMYTPTLSQLFTAIPRSLVGYVKPIDNGIVKENILENIKDNYAYTTGLEDGKIVSLKDIRLTTVKAKSKTRLVQDRYLGGLFATDVGKTLDFITNPEKIYYTNIFEYLKGRESSVNISGSGVNYSVNYRATRSLTGGLIPMSIYIDGAPSSNFYAATIPLRDIALVQIRGSGFVGAEGNGAGGVLAIFTKKGEDVDKGSRFAGNLSYVKLEGFSPVKEFFSPDYSNGKSPDGADKRTTLLWDPYIETGKDNKTIHIPFFNSAGAKQLRMVLTGMTADGKMLYIEKIIE